MSQRKKASKREQLIQDIMWLSHNIGREICKQDVLNMFEESSYCDDYSFLRRLRNVLYKRWLEHQLPIENENETD